MHEHVLRQVNGMNLKTKKTTLCAMMAALSVAFMFIGNLFPTGRMGFMAIASLFTVSIVIHYGYILAVLMFVVSTILGLLILPDKTPIAFYALFFGYYPIIKSFAERKKRVMSWIIKMFVFNIALTVIFIFMKELLLLRFFEKLSENILGIVIYITFNVIFIVYDIGLSRLIGFYMTNIYNKIH